MRRAQAAGTYGLRTLSRTETPGFELCSAVALLRKKVLKPNGKREMMREPRQAGHGCVSRTIHPGHKQVGRHVDQDT